MIVLAVALICFRGDGSPLSDVCVSTWEASTVIECASAGDVTVPFNVNTGTRNPGPGYVRLLEDLPYGGGQRTIAETAFSSRGSSWPATAVIINESDDFGFHDGMEQCACHTRAFDPVAACGGVR